MQNDSLCMYCSHYVPLETVWLAHMAYRTAVGPLKYLLSGMPRAY